jgi:energy-coupling factor transport system ATP-binding protein
MFLELKDIHFSYMKGTKLEKPVLERINLSIKGGELVALIGPTGSGKSTLIQHFNGLLKPDRGKVYVDGKAIGEMVAPRLIRQKIGLVFQFPEKQLFEETVFDEVAFGAKNVGCPEKELEIRVSKALSMVGLDYNRFKDRSPFSLSGGEMRRIAIAGVLAMEPKVLILDEPTSGLDAHGKEEIIKSVKRLKDKEKLAIILVSHDMDEVASIAERIIVLNKGRIIFDDLPGRVFVHAEELEKIGLGIPQVTSLMIELAKNGFEVPTNIYDLEKAKITLLNYFKK